MSNNKQSSIDYLFERFYANEGMITTKQLEQAKAMHKEEIAEAYWNGSDGIEDKSEMLKIGYQYYNETYGGKNE